jgi:hypothetical protein
VRPAPTGEPASLMAGVRGEVLAVPGPTMPRPRISRAATPGGGLRRDRRRPRVLVRSGPVLRVLVSSGPARTLGHRRRDQTVATPLGQTRGDPASRRPIAGLRAATTRHSTAPSRTGGSPTARRGQIMSVAPEWTAWPGRPSRGLWPAAAVTTETLPRSCCVRPAAVTAETLPRSCCVRPAAVTAETLPQGRRVRLAAAGTAGRLPQSRGALLLATGMAARTE